MGYSISHLFGSKQALSHMWKLVHKIPLKISLTNKCLQNFVGFQPQKHKTIPNKYLVGFIEYLYKEYPAFAIIIHFICVFQLRVGEGCNIFCCECSTRSIIDHLNITHIEYGVTLLKSKTVKRGEQPHLMYLRKISKKTHKFW